MPGADRRRVLRALAALPAERARGSAPTSRRSACPTCRGPTAVNLSVLALVALFTGAFLVFSVLCALGRQAPAAVRAARRARHAERATACALVLAESALLGLAGSVLGLALGTALASLALRWLSGRPRRRLPPRAGAPALQFGIGPALAYGAFGVVAAIAGGRLPARAALIWPRHLALKGPGGERRSARPWLRPALPRRRRVARLLGPPIWELPIAAYASVACVLLGGIACVPMTVDLALRGIAPPQSALMLLAVERARRQRDCRDDRRRRGSSQAWRVGGADGDGGELRDSVMRWLDTVLPAELYVRGASSLAAGDSVFLAPEFVGRWPACPA